MRSPLSSPYDLYWALCVVLAALQGVHGEIATITWENFTLVQQGEWLLEFYAPWCPACKQFASTWEDLGHRFTGTEVGIGKVDVTKETMLSGRFMVTHLPSIFHIKDGEVRQYTGDRNLEALVDYIFEKEYEKEEPISYWKSPTAPHMYAVGTIFWLSERAREVQVMLEEQYNLPTYAIFIVIAVVTIVLGLGIGGLVVCVIETCLRCLSGRKEGKGAAPPNQPVKKPGAPSKDSGGTEEVADVGSNVKAGGEGGARKRK